KKETKTYNTGDSPVVTDLSTNPAISSLTLGERTGSRIFYCLWSYVTVLCKTWVYIRMTVIQHARQDRYMCIS
ncbi:hypothetical protein MYCTH_2064829, partial [Thermothelomyces thermophilus ATCC 42464]